MDVNIRGASNMDVNLPCGRDFAVILPIVIF